MKIENTVTINADADQVFALINDVERVVTCLPGAALQGRDGDTYRGSVTVQVGPISAGYEGVVRFVEVDPANRNLRLSARGTDIRGSGDAEAEVRLAVGQTAAGAVLSVDTDLLITGKIAQFGKGAIVAVSKTILDQFAANLAAMLSGNPQIAPVEDVTAPERPSAAQPRPDSTAVPATSNLNVVSVVLLPMLRTYAKPAAVLALSIAHGYLLGRAITIERFYRAGAASAWTDGVRR